MNTKLENAVREIAAQRSLDVNVADVMREAWFCYRRQAGADFPFSRNLFAAHLRSAWSVCRQVAHARATGSTGFLEPSDPNWI